uniref:Uncharacterized protein n=1 Tax=Hucho hucho TaxID=62062 RepID=A0A4W5PP73_9TELE
MLVAIRKRSWEDHVTHHSGLQYSYDDLDLVCCHGVSGDGLEPREDLSTLDESNITDPGKGTGAIQPAAILDSSNKPEGDSDVISDVNVEILEAPAADVMEREAMEEDVESKALEWKAEDSVEDNDGLNVQRKVHGSRDKFDQILRGQHAVSVDGRQTEQEQHDSMRTDDGCEIAQDQTVLRKEDVYMVEMEGTRGEERALEMGREKTLEDKASIASFNALCVTGQHSEKLDRRPLAGQQNLESSKVDKIQERTIVEDMERSTIQVSREELEHSRLDSMVLLLMKLDQLDQEIDTALSASSSSMAITPTLRRHHQCVSTSTQRQRLEFRILF